jgi:MoxR-like ATPase
MERTRTRGPDPDVGEAARRLVANVESVIFGKREAVTLAIVGLLAEGHLLLEDVPGTGKTTLARALAKSVGARFRRIQFTSDLLPADVLGVTVYDADKGSFRFKRGPVFANVVLADELNRTTPRTQSALLECMNERQVSMDGVPVPLPEPFLVVATQNPLEFEGTYPLPESQLDRFLLRLQLGYPDREHEHRVLLSRATEDPLEVLEPVVSVEEVLALQARVRQVRVDPALVEYMLDLAAATRGGEQFLHGASPRATLGLFRAVQALAVVEGRSYCVPDDVKRLAVPVLAHRLMPAPLDGTYGGEPASAEDLVAEILDSLPVPE